MGYIVERKNGIEDYYEDATYASVDETGHLSVNSQTARLIAMYAPGEWVCGFADKSKQKVVNRRVYPVWDFEQRKADYAARRNPEQD